MKRTTAETQVPENDGLPKSIGESTLEENSHKKEKPLVRQLSGFEAGSGVIMAGPILVLPAPRGPSLY
jgi:hypothetical protein